MSPEDSRPWWRPCRWCRSPWWRRASWGRPRWQTDRGFPWRRRGPGCPPPAHRPAATGWRARTPRRDWTSPPACRLSAPPPVGTQRSHAVKMGCWQADRWTPFVSLSMGPLLHSAAASCDTSLVEWCMMGGNWIPNPTFSQLLDNNHDSISMVINVYFVLFSFSSVDNIISLSCCWKMLFLSSPLSNFKYFFKPVK